MTDPKQPFEYMQDNVANLANMMPQAKAIGSYYIAIKKGYAECVLPWNEALLGNKEKGIMASGAVVTLIDQTCGLACISATDTPKTLATLDLRIDYMRAGQKGRDIICKANCYRITNNVAFVRAFAYDSEDENDPISAAQACFMINSDMPMGGTNAST